MRTKNTNFVAFSIMIAFVAAIAAGAVILAVARTSRQDGPYFPPRPEDTSLEFWICDDASEIDWSGHEEITGWFGAWEFLGKGYHIEQGSQQPRPRVRVSYILTAWPDYSDIGRYITEIEITDPTVSVYGLTVNSRPQEFEQVMTSMGYTVTMENDGLIRAVRDDFTFLLQQGDAPELRVTAHVSNRNGIVF